MTLGHTLGFTQTQCRNFVNGFFRELTQVLSKKSHSQNAATPLFRTAGCRFSEHGLTFCVRVLILRQLERASEEKIPLMFRSLDDKK